MVVFGLAFVVVYVAHPVVFAEESFVTAFAAVDGLVALLVPDLPLVVDFAVFRVFELSRQVWL